MRTMYWLGFPVGAINFAINGQTLNTGGKAINTLLGVNQYQPPMGSVVYLFLCACIGDKR